jgi:Holliday junction resolvase
MNKFTSAAITILKEAGISLHYTEITRRALEKGILETSGKTPEATMNSEIVMNIKTKKGASDFVRTDLGTYAINPEKQIAEPEPTPTPVAEPKNNEKQEEEKIDSSYIGKGGEYLVCSHLLFKGFNASIMTVDTGVDIVAIKNNQMFGIQVKTSRLNRANTYIFDVRKVSFEHHAVGNTFYILVLYGKEVNFMILPYNELEKKVYEKAIVEVNHGERYRITIKVRGSDVYLGTKDHKVNFYLNNWSIIR